jgi:hypothetical protein
VKSDRTKFNTRRIVLVGAEQRQLARAMIDNMPIDPLRPLEIIAREQVSRRGQDANAAMWAGPLKDISEQAWVQGKQYTAEVWHEHFKREFLPDVFDEGLCLAGYRKWDYLPNGDRVMVGSTTQLTKHGFGCYMQAVEAFGAGLGVRFNVREES